MQVSLNDFVVKAVAMALRKVPEINVLWDNASGQSKSVDKVDISVAVATDNGFVNFSILTFVQSCSSLNKHVLLRIACHATYVDFLFGLFFFCS